jgi:HSP20 family protein
MFGLFPFGGFIANGLVENLLTGLINNMLTQPTNQTIQISGNIMSSDVRETPDAYILQAHLPGVKRESLKVKYINNYLTITASSNQYVQNRNGGYVRYIGNINRSFYFEDIDGEKVDGIFENGILKLILPKKKQPVNK